MNRNRLVMQLLIWMAAPAGAWGGSIFGPSGAQASATMDDSYYGNVFGSCNSGLQAISADCPLTAGGTGQFAGLTGWVDPRADLHTGDLTVMGMGSGVAGPTMGAVGGTASLEDTVYFGPYANDFEMGTITVTASGTGGRAALDLTEHFEDPPVWIGIQGQSLIAYSYLQRALACNYLGYQPYVEECSSSSGGNMMLSLTFPLDSHGVYFTVSLSASVAGGSVSYTDPISISLPTGVTFTSASGQFLATTPEPGTLPAAIVALAAMAAGSVILRRRRPKY
jgi:hypothetical protein